LVGGCQGIKLSKSSFVLGQMVLMFFKAEKNGVIKQIHNTYAPHSIGVYCMAHHTNLAFQVTLLGLPLVV